MGQCLREERRQLCRFIVRRIAGIIRLQGLQGRESRLQGSATWRCQQVRFACLTGQSNGGKCGKDPHRALRFENVNGAGFSI